MEVIQVKSGDKLYKTPDGAFSSITTILRSTMPEEENEKLLNWQKRIGSEAEIIRLRNKKLWEVVYRVQ